MKIIKPSYEIEEFDATRILRNIEKAGKTCYKSEHTITEDIQSAKEFIKMILRKGHESVLEHEKITVRIICDRGVTHEIVRHRLVSYSQESTRYCNYADEKFGKQITVIDIREQMEWQMKKEYGKISGIQLDTYIQDAMNIWLIAMGEAEEKYNRLIELGIQPELARSVLPNSLKTEIVVTANLREWRHIFRLRTSKRAHPQMKEVIIPLLKELKEKLPIIFDDIAPEETAHG